MGYLVLIVSSDLTNAIVAGSSYGNQALSWYGIETLTTGFAGLHVFFGLLFLEICQKELKQREKNGGRIIRPPIHNNNNRPVSSDKGSLFVTTAEVNLNSFTHNDTNRGGVGEQMENERTTEGSCKEASNSFELKKLSGKANNPGVRNIWEDEFISAAR